MWEKDLHLNSSQRDIHDKEQQNKPLQQSLVSGSVSVEDALAFAAYFRNNFDYYDCNANGRVYKWIDFKKRDQSAITKYRRTKT